MLLRVQQCNCCWKGQDELCFRPIVSTYSDFFSASEELLNWKTRMQFEIETFDAICMKFFQNCRMELWKDQSGILPGCQRRLTFTKMHSMGFCGLKPISYIAAYCSLFNFVNNTRNIHSRQGKSGKWLHTTRAIQVNEVVTRKIAQPHSAKCMSVIWKCDSKTVFFFPSFLKDRWRLVIVFDNPRLFQCGLWHLTTLSKKARTLQKRHLRKRCQLNSSFRDCNKNNKKDKHYPSLSESPNINPRKKDICPPLCLIHEGERKDVKSACLAFLTRNKCAVSWDFMLNYI